MRPCSVRSTANGALDTSFGTNGAARIDYAAGDSDEAQAVIVQPDGKIVLAGHLLLAAPSDYLIARLNANGSRDATFGANGLVTLPLSTDNDLARGLALQPGDGRIVVAGIARNSSTNGIGMLRPLP